MRLEQYGFGYRERALLAFDDATFDDYGSRSGPCVADNPTSLVDADISVQYEDVAFDGSVNVEIATGDGDWSFDDGICRDRAVAQREILGVGQSSITGSATLLDLFGDLPRTSGRRL
jgi:hypothetical protein